MAIKPVEILIKARDEASGIFGTLQGKVAAVGVAIAGYFGISAFIGAVKGASDLEAKLSEVKAVSGATATEMVLLRKAAEDAGATTKFTATEGADALGNLARAGLSAKDAITALPAVLNLAQAGGIGLAEASEYVTKAVMGMGLAFSDAGRVADVLAAGANGSKTSVTGLAQALSYTAPIAKSLGLGLEFTVAIIGKFADAGIDASRAGTALNAVLSQFADPSSKFRQELGSAGIITGNFEKALRQLAAAGPAGEKAILAVGTEAGPALRALLNQGIGALDDLKGKLDAAKGSAAATAAVMEDNLKGSFNSLSSSWDTVKNALATPVLPVLRDGVTQLSDALSRSVADGTIGKFGDAIATAFQGGLKWAREFLGTVDFAALTTRMQAFAARAQEIFTQISDYATNAGSIVKTTYGVMSAGTNAVLTAVYGLGVAFSGVVAGIQNALALLYEGMAKITFGGISAGYKQMAADIRLSAEGTSAASRALADKTIESFTAMGNSAQIARDGWAGLTADTTAATNQAAASTQVFKGVAETLKEVGGDATATGQKAIAAGILQKQAADDTRMAVAQLKTEYEAAMAAGNVQLAVEKLQALQGALKSTGDQAKLTGQDIENAFTRMGITSSAELAKVRDAALRDYKIIKDAATSTAHDKAEAFRVYAEKAIAANNGVATEALKSEAAMRGIEVQTDSTGKTIVKAMGAGKTATNEFEGSVRSASGAIAEQNLMLKQQKDAMDALRSATTAAPVKSNLTKDDMKAVDNTGLFSLQQKSGTGTLTAADLATAQAAFNTASTNLDVYQKNWSVFSLDGAKSIQDSYNASRAILERVKALDSQKNTVSSTGTSSTSTAKNYTVNVNIGGTSTAINTSSDADAQALIKLLQSSKLSSGL